MYDTCTFQPLSLTNEMSIEIKQRQKAHEFANTLRMWMFDNVELYALKMKYAEAFAKQMRKEKFNLNRAIELMKNLRIVVQANYNKHNKHISVHKECIHIVQKDLLMSVLFAIFDQNRDIQQEATKYITQLDD
jgi:hypothetical protein